MEAFKEEKAVTYRRCAKAFASFSAVQRTYLQKKEGTC